MISTKYTHNTNNINTHKQTHIQNTHSKSRSVEGCDAVVQLTVVEELVGYGADIRVTSVLGVEHGRLVTLQHTPMLHMVTW